MIKNSTVFLVMRLPGGVVPKLKCKTLTPLPGYVTITNDPKEPCMISLDDDEHISRAKMFCGHVIGGCLGILFKLLSSLNYAS